MRKQRMVNVLTETNDTITSRTFLNESRISEKYFTRKRKMSFVGIMTFIINFLSKPLQDELDNYFEIIENGSRISQQAFSKARQHIKPEAFKKLFDITVNEVTKDFDSFKRFKGYRIFAVDGTELSLEPTKELVKHFGQKANYKNCKARASILCEINEGIIIDGQMESFKVDERTLAKKHIEAFEKIKGKKDLIIFDRGYPSKDLISILSDKNIKYLIRLPKGFNKEIDESTKEDFYVTITHQGKSYKVRVIKVQIPSTDPNKEGEIEILSTNLGRNQFKKSEFIELYFKRWPIETKYNTLKNKLKIESFSGKTLIAVQQDFYATMYLSNLVAFSKAIADEEIQLQNKDKDLKYEYQANESKLIGKLRNKLILCLLIDDPEKRGEAFDKIIVAAIYNKSAKKPDRHFERTHTVKRKKSIKRYPKSSL